VSFTPWPLYRHGKESPVPIRLVKKKFVLKHQHGDIGSVKLWLPESREHAFKKSSLYGPFIFLSANWSARTRSVYLRSLSTTTVGLIGLYP
jgi:hypothetical protein